jgi:hypothetical protein
LAIRKFIAGGSNIKVLKVLESYSAHGHWMERTNAQTEAEWVTHGNIARLQYALETEMDDSRRRGLEGLLKEQRALVTVFDDGTVLDAVGHLE